MWVGDPAPDPAQRGVDPMRADSQGKVPNLNSDELDGKSADQIGVNGLTLAHDESASDSSNSKYAFEACPVEGNARKAVVGTGYKINGAPYWNGKVVVTQENIVSGAESPYPWAIAIHAVEEQPYSGDWNVSAEAICARAGTPGQIASVVGGAAR